MPDVKFLEGVIVVPAATVDGNTNPGSVMASADEFIDMADFSSLHVPMGLLSFDHDFTVPVAAAVRPRVPRRANFVMNSFVTSMDRDPWSAGGGNAMMLGGSSSSGPASPGFPMVPAGQEEAIA